MTSSSSSQPSIVSATPLLLLPFEPQRRRGHVLSSSSTCIFLLLCALALVAGIQQWREGYRNKSEESTAEQHKGGDASEKKVGFNWTEEMLSWERTAYHFQTQKNWMNDPDGPVYHMGWYHLFYQYNPDSAAWGNITWGHAVSTDLIHWLYLPLAMVPDHQYDLNGVWTGSATVLSSDPGRIVILYTGDTADSGQVQNLAYPADPSDPLLLRWVKHPQNPVIVPPVWIEPKYFRDPTTGWLGADGRWRVAVGSRSNETGVALVYRTEDFAEFELMDEPLHAVPGTGMWECVDFFPVSTQRDVGLDTSSRGPHVRHVLKVSLDEEDHDYYAVGGYDEERGVWEPDEEGSDVGRGERVDYGVYYASKSFYDPKRKRRVLYGWSRETDAAVDDSAKGWASLQTIPRTVLFDKKMGKGLVQWPVEEVESLRLEKKKFSDVVVPPGSIVPLDVMPTSQLDIMAEFKVGEPQSDPQEDDESERCGGAWQRKRMGPFGILVLATATLSERTAVYFDASGGRESTLFCTDVTRSSLAPDVVQEVYGSTVPVVEGERLTARTLVDHSVVESFGQGGRRCITARVYPTEAIRDSARIFLFNNATAAGVTASVEVWQMGSASIHPFTPPL